MHTPTMHAAFTSSACTLLQQYVRARSLLERKPASKVPSASGCAAPPPWGKLMSMPIEAASIHEIVRREPLKETRLDASALAVIADVHSPSSAALAGFLSRLHGVCG